MLVVILPGILLLIVGGIIGSAYLIFKPEPLATVEEKARERQRPRADRRPGPPRVRP